jgi:hypothetical protein
MQRDRQQSHFFGAVRDKLARAQGGFVLEKNVLSCQLKHGFWVNMRAKHT